MSGALFSGLVIDELDRPVDVTLVGDESFYVFDDDGFRRHVESRFVDRQVLEQMRAMIQGNEALISEGTMKMLGQEDIFTKAMIERSLRNVDEQFDQLLAQGLPGRGTGLAGDAWLSCGHRRARQRRAGRAAQRAGGTARMIPGSRMAGGQCGMTRRA